MMIHIGDGVVVEFDDDVVGDSGLGQTRLGLRDALMLEQQLARAVARERT